MESKYVGMGENIGSMVAPRHDVNAITTMKMCDEILIARI